MNKIWLLIAAALIIVICAVAGASSEGSSTGGASQQRPDPKYRFTITANQVTAVMLDTVKVTNENTGESIYIFYNDLPETLNFAPGDVISFEVKAKSNYKLNGWIFDDGTFSDSNPLSLKPRGSFSMDARMMPAATITTP